MNLSKLIWAGVAVCLLSAPFGAAARNKGVDLSVEQWITQNPPSSEEMSNHVCVVEFWATWCPPCRRQIPHIQALAKEYQDRNIIFVGLSVDDSASKVRNFVEKEKINYNIGMDNGLSDRLGVNGIPAVFVFDNGKIVWGGNPGDTRFEQVLSMVTSTTPKPLLTGVEMGRYSYLRIKLCGGKDFAKAYSELEGCAKHCTCSENHCACKVCAAVNAKLRQKIAAAEEMRGKDPQTALGMYKELIDKYSGISLINQIEPAYKELQQTAKKTSGAQAKANI